MKFIAAVCVVLASLLALAQEGGAQSGLITTGCGVLPTCGANQVAACCEPCYSVYCYYINRNCGKNCVKGCYCQLGYVQMKPNGPCVNKLLCRSGK
uniref:TIL domain-containing protein n=1 Tax=Anopheles funestus TaxID=62324 RepID=A0A182RT70_ANOFN